MSEGLPKPPTKPVDNLEAAPASYRQALDSVRLLFDAGVVNPLDIEDPQARVSLDVIASWYHSRNLHMRGVGTPDKASDIVRAARLWLDAGYGGIEFLNSAREKLLDEHADALRENNEDVTSILRVALEDVERAIGRHSPEEKSPVIVTAKLEEAKAYVEQGKITDAIGVLTLALYDTRFKRLSKVERDRIESYRDDLKKTLLPKT